LAGRPLENTELLHLGINSHLFGINKSAPILKQSFKLPADARVVLSARAFTPLYRHEEILLAFSKIFSALRKKTVLVFKRFNESDKGYYTKISTLVKELGLEDFVYWVEQVSDAAMPDLYYISDVIVNFPVQDAFPVTFLEAAVSQKPVITNKFPSYENTFVVDCFRLIKNDSIEGLAQALLDELEVTPTLPENIEKARLAAMKHFSEERYINRLAEIYVNLLEGA
jgi:glycosyltransferase involved in cell wall biosynthesis